MVGHPYGLNVVALSLSFVTVFTVVEVLPLVLVVTLSLCMLPVDVAIMSLLRVVVDRSLSLSLTIPCYRCYESGILFVFVVTICLQRYLIRFARSNQPSDHYFCLHTLFASLCVSHFLRPQVRRLLGLFRTCVFSAILLVQTRFSQI